MTVNDLLENLRQIADQGNGDALVCISDFDETACSGDMLVVRDTLLTKYQSLIPEGKAPNGAPAFLLI